MTNKLFKINATIIEALAEADFDKETLTFYFNETKKDTIAMVLSDADVPFDVIENNIISVTCANNIKTGLHALVNGKLMPHDWMSEIITHFPTPDGKWHRLSGESFFKSNQEKEQKAQQKAIETQLDKILDTTCSFYNMGTFGGSFIFLPKDTKPENLEKYVHLLQEAKIIVKIDPHKNEPCLNITKKETTASFLDKLEQVNALKKLNLF